MGGLMREAATATQEAQGAGSVTVASDSKGRRAGELLAFLSRLLAGWRGNGALVSVLLVGIVASLTISNFATRANLIQVVESESYVGLAAIGMTFVVLSGQFIDLSVPASAALAANALFLVSHQLPVALLAAVVLPLSVGLINGFLVGRVGLNSVVCTLGTATAVTGLLLLWSGGQNVYGNQPGFVRFANASVVGVPSVAITFVVLVVAAQIVLSFTAFGARLRLTGSNAQVARALGLRSHRVVASCFVLSALFAALAGIFLAGFWGAAQLTTGSGFDFGALVPVVIGGTALAGGRGSFWRTFVGLMLIGITTNAMLLLGFSTSAQLTATAIIFLLAIALDAYSQRHEQ
jgi:ribose transport system permease protein